MMAEDEKHQVESKAQVQLDSKAEAPLDSEQSINSDAISDDSMPASKTDAPAQSRGFVKPLLTAFAVVATLALLLHLSSNVFRPKTNVTIFGDLYDVGVTAANAEPADTIDAVIVGDSVTLFAYDPLAAWQERGVTSYTLATLAQNFTEGFTLLKASFDQQKPRVVFIEVSLLYTDFSINDVVMADACELFPVLRYHSRWRDLSLEDFTSEPHMDQPDPAKGYYLDTTVNPAAPDMLADYMEPSDEVAGIEPLTSAYLEGMVNWVRAQGATPVLINIPTLRYWNMTRHNAMVRWAEERGVDYLDLNTRCDELGIDWSQDTCDGGVHLGVNGAHKVSRYLANVLADEYGLADHRGDAAYDQWDADVASTYYDELDPANPDAYFATHEANTATPQ